MRDERTVVVEAIEEYRQKVDLLAERDAFEAWYATLGISSETEHHDDYLGYGAFSGARNMDRWLAWLARAAMSVDDTHHDTESDNTGTNSNEMLVIQNDGPFINKTNFWELDSPLAHGVYLSHNAGVLRLLLPKSHVENYLSDFLNAKFVEICPTCRAEKPGFVDIVFVDGTKDPFSFAIRLDVHADFQPVDGECALIVYCGSLEKQLKLPAIVRLDALQKEPYFVQVTKNTNTWRPVSSHGVDQKVVSVIHQYMEGFLNDKVFPIDLAGRKYVIRMSWVSMKLLIAEVAFADGKKHGAPLLRFGIALDEEAGRLLWQEMRCQGAMPSAPIIVAEVLSATRSEDMVFLADFERMMAWSWYRFALDHSDLLHQLIQSPSPKKAL